MELTTVTARLLKTGDTVAVLQKDGTFRQITVQDVYPAFGSMVGVLWGSGAVSRLLPWESVCILAR